MNVTIIPSKLSGTIPAISSKSAVHRLLLCAALSEGETFVACGEHSLDVLATLHCLKGLGATVHTVSDGFRITPGSPPPSARFFCQESGSTLRFLLPIAAALGIKSDFTMAPRLFSRPIQPLVQCLTEHGVTIERENGHICTCGVLQDPQFSIRADISSQFLSGLMFALPLMGGGRIRFPTPPVSAGYLRMTAEALEAFGVAVHLSEAEIFVSGEAYRSPGKVLAEGDWSNGAFWLAAGALCGDSVTVTGLNDHSVQGDRAIGEELKKLPGGNAVIQGEQIPDLIPVLAAVAALTPGKTVIRGAARLRGKETDRLESTAGFLRDLGAVIRITADGLEIEGKGSLTGGTTRSRGDHRIAMAAAIASVGCLSPVTVQDAEAVDKSYPGFWDDFQRLGGTIRKEETNVQYHR